MLLDLMLRWMHILSAIVLVGGTFFLRFSLAPTLAAQSEETRASLLTGWRPGWARLVMITSGLLLISGLVNAVRIIKAYEFASPYHVYVAVKLILALAIFWLSASIAGRSNRAEQFRQRMTHWLTINVLLSVLIVGLAGFMKLSPRTPKLPDAPSVEMAPNLPATN